MRHTQPSLSEYKIFSVINKCDVMNFKCGSNYYEETLSHFRDHVRTLAAGKLLPGFYAKQHGSINKTN